MLLTLAASLDRATAMILLIEQDKPNMLSALLNSYTLIHTGRRDERLENAGHRNNIKFLTLLSSGLLANQFNIV